MHDGQAARLDEAARGEGRQPELVGSPLGGEAPAHGAERALGRRAVARRATVGRCTRRRWSREGFTNVVCTRTQRSSASDVELGRDDCTSSAPTRLLGRGVDVVGPARRWR